MFNKKSEEGYTLVLVLLIITVFSIIFLSFMGQAISGTKQNKIVEKSSQSVALAEMGISYYEVEFQRIFEVKQVDVNNQVINILKADSTKDYKAEATNAMKTALDQAMSNGLIKTTVQVEGYPNSTFSIKNFNSTADPTNRKISLKFDVEGSENGKTTTLNADMVIDLALINLAGGSINPEYNQVEKPTNVSTQCINPSTFTDISCPNGVIIDKSMTYTEQYNGYVGTIYSTGDLVLSGNGNKSKLTLHADSVSLNGNLNSIVDITLESEKNANFGGQLRVENSDLYIGGNMTTDDHVTLALSSRIWTRGNASIGKSLTIDPTSTMCVKGDLSAQQLDIQVNGTQKGRLIIKGSVNVDPSKISGNPPIIVTNSTDKDFLTQNCGNTFDDYNSIDWSKSNGAVIGDVTYN
jgi:Tfp pilus assembly protein PilX/cytoskeletal protein CcmA (bactofilin family)